MTPRDIYQEALNRGLRLEAEGEFLAIYPKGKCSPDFADVLRAHKLELLDWLTKLPCPGWQAVPPDDLPLVVAVPRPSHQDRERAVNYLWRQTDGQPGVLAKWLVQRENGYFEGPGNRWDCGILAYAAARDAACWQLNRSEADVWELLATFQEVAKFNRSAPSGQRGGRS